MAWYYGARAWRRSGWRRGVPAATQAPELAVQQLREPLATGPAVTHSVDSAMARFRKLKPQDGQDLKKIKIPLRTFCAARAAASKL